MSLGLNNEDIDDGGGPGNRVPLTECTCDHTHYAATITRIQDKYHHEVKRANALRALLAGPAHYAQQRIDNADYPSDVLTAARLYDQDKLVVKIRELMRVEL